MGKAGEPKTCGGTVYAGGGAGLLLHSGQEVASHPGQ